MTMPEDTKLQNLSKHTRENVSILYTHIHTSIRTCTNEKEQEIWLGIFTLVI